MALLLEQRLMIEHLKRQGYSIRRIARELGISRNTVKRYLQDPQRSRYHRRVAYLSKLDSFKEYITTRLRDFPDISAEKLYREAKDKGFDGSYRIVADYVNKFRPPSSQKVFIRFETSPGSAGPSRLGRIWKDKPLWKKL